MLSDWKEGGGSVHQAWFPPPHLNPGGGPGGPPAGGARPRVFSGFFAPPRRVGGGGFVFLNTLFTRTPALLPPPPPRPRAARGRGRRPAGGRRPDRRIPAAQVPLYGNLSSYNLLPGSGTRTDGRSVTLGSLLDTGKARTVHFGEITFTQIPFLPDGEPSLAEYGADLAPDIGAATVIRKFYVETLQDGVRHRFVAAMVAEAQYAANHPDFDYLEMPGFTGAVLLSTPEGNVFRVENYRGGLAGESVLLPQREIAGKSGLHYLKLYRPADTRAGGDPDEWELESAVCLAEKPETDRAEKSALLISHPQYTVSLTTNLPDYVDVKGCGTYSSGSWATLGGFPRHTFYSLDFGRWTGDFAGEKRPYFPWKVTHDIQATAWYEDPARAWTWNGASRTP